VLQRVYIIIFSLKNSSCPICGRVYELNEQCKFCEDGQNKLFKPSYCHYLVGDANILLFLYFFYLEKIPGFVLKEILTTETLA